MLNSSRFPYFEAVLSIGTWSIIEHFYLDTGFEGGLLIPAYLRHEVLASPRRIRLRVAHDENRRGAVVGRSRAIGNDGIRC